jgi:hypothetical protein
VRRSPALVLAALLLPAGLVACSDDGGGDRVAAGDGFSVEGGLAELAAPPDADEGQMITLTVVDLDAAAAANGGAAPDDEEALVFVPPIEALGGSRGARADEVEAELGWSLDDVDALAEVVAPPFRFAVVTGDVDEDALARADLAQDGEIYSAGDGEDLEQDPDDVTAARPIGAPLRMAVDDGRLAASSSTAAVEGWLEGDGDTLAADDDLAAVAAALDEADAVSAFLARGDLTSRAAAIPDEEVAERLADELPIAEPFSAVGVGWGAEDGEAVMTVAYAFGDEDTATAAVTQVEAAFTGASLQTRRPLTDLVTVEEVEADGSVVVAHLTLGEDGRARVLADMLISRDLPFVHV